MSQHKPKTPEELAQSRSTKKSYSLYLKTSSMEFIRSAAGSTGVSVSEVVDEVLLAYILTLKKKPKR